MCQSPSSFSKSKIREDYEADKSLVSVKLDDGAIKTSTKNIKHKPASKLYLPRDYCVSDHDVLCGRGAYYFNHVGNQTFRKLIELNVERYDRANTKYEKTTIIMEMIQTIRTRIPHKKCYFLKKDSRKLCYYDIGDYVAREKVSQAFRDAIMQKQKVSKYHHNEIRSSSKTNSNDSGSDYRHYNSLLNHGGDDYMKEPKTLKTNVTPEYSNERDMGKRNNLDISQFPTITNSYPYHATNLTNIAVDDSFSSNISKLNHDHSNRIINNDNNLTSWDKTTINKVMNDYSSMSQRQQHQQPIQTSHHTLFGIPQKPNQSKSNDNQGNDIFSNSYWNTDESNCMRIDPHERSFYNDIGSTINTQSIPDGNVEKIDVMNDEDVFETLLEFFSARINNAKETNDNPYEPIPL
jgi:hypothetical protein